MTARQERCSAPSVKFIPEMVKIGAPGARRLRLSLCSIRSIRKPVEAQRADPAHQRKLDAIAIKPREDLVKAQAEELRNVGQKLHGWRVEARRKQGKALDVLKQKFRNLETDQSHAHAIEFNLAAEIDGARLAQPRRCRRSLLARTDAPNSLEARLVAVVGPASATPRSTVARRQSRLRGRISTGQIRASRRA